jgi:hypothetical protein
MVRKTTSSARLDDKKFSDNCEMWKKNKVEISRHQKKPHTCFRERESKQKTHKPVFGCYGRQPHRVEPPNIVRVKKRKKSGIPE